jgi:hypothetical protein
MGRGGCRVGAGRPGWRPCADDLVRVDVRELHQVDLFEEPDRGRVRIAEALRGFTFDGRQLTLDVPMDGGTRRLTIQITWTRCHFGGQRPWFQCGQCARRVAVLFVLHRQFECRLCANVSYRSQRLDAIDRSWKRQRKTQRRLDPAGERPRGMHRKTYDDSLREIRRCEKLRILDLTRWLGRRRLRSA